MLHDAEGELCQNLLTTDNIPGTHLTSVISVTMHAGTLKKYFINLYLMGNQLIYTVNGKFENQFLIFLILKSVQVIFTEKH